MIQDGVPERRSFEMNCGSDVQCIFVIVRAQCVGAHVLCGSCATQRAPGIKLRLFGLHNKRPYPLGHLASPSICEIFTSSLILYREGLTTVN